MPLSTALENCNAEHAVWLVKRGADVNLAPDGKPLVFSAVCSNSLELVKLLVEAGANLDCSWGSWDSPLTNALAGENQAIVDYLASKTKTPDDQMGAIKKVVTDRMRVKFAKQLNEQDLAGLEEKLKLKIPPTYRQFLKSFPDDLVTDDDQGVFHSVELIFRSTIRARAYCEEEWEAPFPGDLICVGWNGGSSVFCVRVGEQGEQIYLFDHEIGKINPHESQSLDQFTAMFRE